MTGAPIPIASYLASLTMNFYDVADVRVSGNALVEVTGGTGVIDIPIAQGVRGLSTFAGTTIPTATVPSTADTDDLYVYGGATGGGVTTGDVLRKAGDDTWSVVGTVRGTTGATGATGADGGTGGTTPPSMTGATAATRYVGGTTTGAPVTGTFLAGDFVIAQDGVVWICTAPGTPGTWASPAARGELGYDVLATASATATGSTVVAALSTAVTIPAGGNRKVQLSTSGQVGISNLSTTGQIRIDSDGNRANEIVPTTFIAASGYSAAFSRVMRFVLAPGVTTFTSNLLRNTGGGTLQMLAGSELIVTDIGPA